MVTPKASIPRKRLITAVGLTAFLLALTGASFYFYSSRSNTPPKLSRAPVSKVADKGVSNSSANPTNNSQVNQATVTAVPTTMTPTVTPTPTPTVTDANGAKTFKGLGVTFRFADKDQGNTGNNYHVIGNTVYLGTLDTSGKSAYSLQVFSKNPADTLQAGITKQILFGYSSADCPISTATLSSGFISARIRYADNNLSSGVGPIDASKCPEQYIPVESGAYFVMDSQHPDKFAFVTTGQVPLDTVDGKGWNNTISFN